MSGFVRPDHHEERPGAAVNVRLGYSYLHPNVLLNLGLNPRDSGDEVCSQIRESRNDLT